MEAKISVFLTILKMHIPIFAQNRILNLSIKRKRDFNIDFTILIVIIIYKI